MTNNKLFLITLILIFSFYGCKKSNLNSSSTTISKNKNTPPKGFFIENKKLPGVVSDENIKLTTSTANAATNSFDPNNGDIPIILGQHLPNPYSVTNMQNAVNTLYGINYPISATHLYVRFKPPSTMTN